MDIEHIVRGRHIYDFYSGLMDYCRHQMYALGDIFLRDGVVIFDHGNMHGMGGMHSTMKCDRYENIYGHDTYNVQDKTMRLPSQMDQQLLNPNPDPCRRFG